MLLATCAVVVPTAWWLVRRTRRARRQRAALARTTLRLPTRRLPTHRLTTHRLPTLRRPPVETDPFEMLTLQFRLSTLATQIQRIEQDQSTLARAHHLRATQYAYDTVLRQACTLVGLTELSGSHRPGATVSDTWVVDEDERMRQELELCARGWSW
ncbi:hypothetical protein [Sanguibacter keddieii]|uniref:hypothetical protein n=1 Tax=Sanguibacter keddieii TaxID=60920 RepID=UPI001FDFA9F1|nr:hypothetical protein [Sanguibacter keddieii]